MGSHSITKAVFDSINNAIKPLGGNKRLGVLVIAEFFDCKNMPTDSLIIEKEMSEVCELLELNVLKKITHSFSPYGLSSVFVLSESHFSVHTWPEHDYVAIDLFSCKEIDADMALRFLSQKFKCSEYSSSVIPRGNGI